MDYKGFDIIDARYNYEDEVKCSYWTIIILSLVLTDVDGFDDSVSVLILRKEENCVTIRENFASSSFLDEFAKLRKATISFVVSVRLYGTTGYPLHGLSAILYLSIFRKYVVKIHATLKSDKNNGHSTSTII